jgi:hypothetical protein
MMPREGLSEKELRVPSLVWQGLIPPRKLVGTTQSVISNHLRSTFGKLGVWSRLELTRYIASHAGQGWRQAHRRHGAAVYSSIVGRSPGTSAAKDLRLTFDLPASSRVTR